MGHQHEHPTHSAQLAVRHCSAIDVQHQVLPERVEQLSCEELASLANDVYEQVTLGSRWCLERCRDLGTVLLVAKVKLRKGKGVLRQWVEPALHVWLPGKPEVHEIGREMG